MATMDRTRQPRRRVESYAALLAMLVAWIFVFPLFATGSFGSLIVGEVVFAGLLLAGVNLAAGRRAEMRLLLVLAGAILVDTTLVYLGAIPGNVTRIALEALRIPFLLLVTWVILRHALKSSTVSFDTILGAVCAYLLIAALFAVAYRLVALTDAGALRVVLEPIVDPSRAAVSRDPFLYFSVVTLTTLGYGDVLPVSPAARALAQIEAVVGQLYVAVVLAWLVGMYMAERRPPAPEDD